MQFLEEPAGTRTPLPRPSIDTGMGLERFAAILQGKHDNYDTDTLRALILASADESHTHPDGPHRVSHRVIADHLRSTAFLIADGVLPSNEGRGYVLRRIMRRAMRHAHLLGTKEPLLYRLGPALGRQKGAAAHAMSRSAELVVEKLRPEEQKFRAMLERGLTLLEDEVGRLQGEAKLPGEVAFKLYDTYGFPLDLTEDALREQGRGVDHAGFQAAMAAQRARARAAWSGSGEAATEAVWFELKEEHGATEFLGYGTESTEATVQAIVRDGAPVDAAEAGDTVAIVLNQTPFYGESGGQVGDTGTLISPGLSVTVTDTQKKAGDLFVHFGTIAEGTLIRGQTVLAAVDGERRGAKRAPHSATHLLHEALRRELGPHVTQKGSLNAPDRLRFDISQPRAITPEELERIERAVNARIRENSEVETRLMSPDEAVERGAMALFGEKYGEEVRVVSMGEGDGNKFAYSIELCGGTHVRRTGDIGAFRIVSESAVAAGVRRIEALAGEAAIVAVEAESKLLAETASVLKVSAAELPSRIGALLEERRRLERQISDLQRKLATGGAGAEVETIGDVKLAARNLGEVAPRELKSLADSILKSLGSGVAALVSTAEGKASIVVGVSPDLTERLNAVTLVRAASAAVGGKGGGGRPDMAQAGGPDGHAAEAALDAVRAALAA